MLHASNYSEFQPAILITNDLQCITINQQIEEASKNI